uniref:Uncharacterized protein n=1 Tax=Anguilla anguilla TaxID=7936 RepID=A0A0E9Q253_ANGAN
MGNETTQEVSLYISVTHFLVDLKIIFSSTDKKAIQHILCVTFENYSLYYASWTTAESVHANLLTGENQWPYEK